MEYDDFAWASGFLEGDGTFSRSASSLMVAANSTDHLLLLRLRAIVGGGSVTGPYCKPARGFTRKPQWSFQAYSFERVQHIVCLVWAWLGHEKRQRAVEMLASFTGRSVSHPGGPSVLMRRSELAWAAGFFDAEGCFAKMTGSSMTARITNSDLEALERFRAAVGVGKIYGPYASRTSFAGRKPIYVFAANGFEKGQALLAMLWFRLGRAKRDKASELIQHYLTTYACGHAREDAPWHKHCPRCFRPGPKPRNRI